MKKKLSYFLLVLNVAVVTYALVLLGLKIGPSWGSAAPFYFVWCLIPNILIHFGISRFGTSPTSDSILLGTAAFHTALTCVVVWAFVIRGPIGPFSMLVFMPLPLTQLILMAPLLWLAYAKRNAEVTAN